MALTAAQQGEIEAARTAEGRTRRPVVPALEAMLFEAIPVLDHGFVRVIDYMGDDAAIVQAIIQMAHALHLSTIAEGVENDEQARFLRSHGCDNVQGYRYCRPVDAAAAAEWIRARLPDRSTTADPACQAALAI